PSVSLHGRDRDIIPEIRRNRALFVLTGGENTPANICRMTAEAELTDLRITVGERLCYPDEKITAGTPAGLASLSFAPLSVMLIQNDHPDAPVTHGLPDELFQRIKGDEKVIPMTKQEIRSVCLSKLALTEDAVCWDIGSGTGSVAVEMALLARKGKVFAVEKDPAAVSLIRKNAAWFHVSNLVAAEGEAPGAVIGLPAPSHVFIGGCSGNIRRIIQILSEKGTEIRVVITAVSLETVSEVNAVLNDYNCPETETVMIQTARAKKAGGHSLMFGGNPVYIFSLKIPAA
ncbi:MAG: precorrin-6Y C5,15-methyltransferase (decarboxylating) subunit CbiT, partial [Anaerolineaceae bacterium]|nr:precorrin-6Y C5,15-methyltransferase (decarboxylating) subunit CbiT [Anaerolineaceae bacterium]